MTKDEILKGYMINPDSMPDSVRKGILQSTERAFFAAVDRFPPGMLEFCKGAREKALALFYKDIEQLINSPINPTSLTFEEFMEVVSLDYSACMKRPVGQVRASMSAVKAGIDSLMRNNMHKYGLPDLSGNTYGNIATPRLFVDNRSFINSVAQSFGHWQLLMAPILTRWQRLAPDRTYAAASYMIPEFFSETQIGRIIAAELAADALANGEEYTEFMAFFAGDNNSLSDGYNVDMPQRVERLIEMVKDLWHNAPNVGLKIDDQDAIGALDRLQHILDVLLEAEPHSLHVQIVAHNTDKKVGGHYSASENQLVLMGPFEEHDFTKGDFIPDGEIDGHSTSVAEVLHHELTHAVEYLAVPGLFVKGSTDYTLNMASIAFIYSRIQENTKMESFAEYPGLCLGFRDEFLFSYVGRVYGEPALMYDPNAEITDVARIVSTEALSTIVGNMQSQPAAFSSFLSDKEHFSHALAVFYGTYYA